MRIEEYMQKVENFESKLTKMRDVDNALKLNDIQQSRSERHSFQSFKKRVNEQTEENDFTTEWTIRVKNNLLIEDR